MALSAEAVKRLMIATADQTIGNEVATAINNGIALAPTSSVLVAVAAKIATSTSTTTDFSMLVAGDVVLKMPAVAGNGIFYTVVTAGTLPAAATIGALYVVLRAVTFPAASAAKF